MNARNKGFTLIELLVVFSLLALLLSIAVPRYLSVTGMSREKVRSQNIATIRDALDKYKADQGSYPSKLEDLVIKQYLRNIPLDPVSGSNNWTLIGDPQDPSSGVYDVAIPVQETTATAPRFEPAENATEPPLGSPPLATLPNNR